MKRKLPNLMFNLTETATEEKEEILQTAVESLPQEKKSNSAPALESRQNNSQTGVVETQKEIKKAESETETIENVLESLTERYLTAKTNGEKVVLSLRFPSELDLFFKALPATLRIELASARRQIPKEDIIAQILLRVLSDEYLRQSVIVPMIEEMIERRR